MNSNNEAANTSTGEIEKFVPLNPKLPVKSIGNLSGLFKNPAVRALVGKGMSSVMSLDHLVKMAIVALQSTPKLRDCTQESFLFALTTAGQLGLDPSGSLGRAYIIPYGNKAQFQIGYKGMIDLVCRSRMAKSLSVHVVWKDEADSMQWDKESTMRHTPNWDAERDYSMAGKGDIAFFYMVANHGEGIYTFSYMTANEVDSHRTKHSKMANGPAWKGSYVEMGKKTMIIRGSKMLPMSTERVPIEAASQFQQAMTSDMPEDADYEEIVIDPNELPVTEKKPAQDDQPETKRTIDEWIADAKAGNVSWKEWEVAKPDYSKEDATEIENRWALIGT